MYGWQSITSHPLLMRVPKQLVTAITALSGDAELIMGHNLLKKWSGRGESNPRIKLGNCQSGNYLRVIAGSRKVNANQRKLFANTNSF
jgi:hypothetical protein